MPQVKDLPVFLNSLKKSGIGWRERKINPAELMPSQTEIDQNKVDNLRVAYRQGILNDTCSVIISKDIFVIDGHHRMAACRLEGVPLRVIQVDMTCIDLIELMKDFPGIA
jgi:ParB-like chromosome segregation protein Spo0J